MPLFHLSTFIYEQKNEGKLFPKVGSWFCFLSFLSSFHHQDAAAHNKQSQGERERESAFFFLSLIKKARDAGATWKKSANTKVFFFFLSSDKNSITSPNLNRLSLCPRFRTYKCIVRQKYFFRPKKNLKITLLCFILSLLAGGWGGHGQYHIDVRPLSSFLRE